MNTNMEMIEAPLAKDEDCDGYTMNCFLCQRIFTDIDELQQHLCIHYAEHSDLNTTTQYFNCNVCERSLRSEQKLQEHYKRYHEATLIRKEMEAGKQFECKLCGNVCLSSQLLLKHVEMTHCPRKEKLNRPATMYAAIQRVTPKIKYPPRSPYFNPNLWVDHNGYI
ncbi:hypothetical protein ACLKA7_013333 [Drosophila subpalustris]